MLVVCLKSTHFANNERLVRKSTEPQRLDYKPLFHTTDKMTSLIAEISEMRS